MQIGDRVTLTSETVKGTLVGATGRRRRIDWNNRQGTVMSVGTFTHSVGVLWEGRRSWDYWPDRALRVIEMHR
jgi:hypothetical protein